MFVLLPSGQQPADSATWNQIHGPDRARVALEGLGASGRASVVVSLNSDANQLQWEVLDERNLRAGDPTKAAFNLSYHLQDVRDTIYVAFGPVGSSCFLEGPANIDEVWNLDPKATLGVFDLHDGNDCSTLTPLATVPLDTTAGARFLVVSYEVDGQVRLLSAPITEP